MEWVSLSVQGDYAAFRDPSVTSNKVVTYAPSKSAVVGLLGALYGVRRSNSGAEIYEKSFVEFYRQVMIGIKVLVAGERIRFYTNHRSLKEAKTKPFKDELLVGPKYNIVVASDTAELIKDLAERAMDHRPHYFPFLGSASCPAKIEFSGRGTAKPENQGEFKTSYVVFDELDLKNGRTSAKLGERTDDTRIMIEEHLYHFYSDGELRRRVCRYYIPTNGSIWFSPSSSPRSRTKVIRVDGEYVCLF